MRRATLDIALLWGLSQAVGPLLALATIVWLASHVVTVSWAWKPGGREVSSQAAPSPSAAPALVMPVQGAAPSDLHDSFTDPRSGGRTHHAIDIPAPRGTPVVAAADGVIMKKRSERLGGRSLYQLAADSSYVYYYAHLSHYASGVRVGLRVEAGDVIGYVGDTGNAPSGAYHLHFAVWAPGDLEPPWSDRPVNPYPLLTGRD